MTSANGPRKRTRGEIVKLPSGSLRVKVYAGIDPVTKKRYYLDEVVSAGPRAAAEAEKLRTKFLNQVDEKRSSRTRATVSQLLDRYFELVKIEETTRTGYESLVRIHIRPLLGESALGHLDGEILDSFYKQLRTCRAHCRGRGFVEHRTERPHQCDGRCGPHKCKPLADSSIRKIQAILSGAGKRAVRWGWIGVNPFDLAEPLPVPRPDPKPPTVEQAARIATEAWRDLDWGMLVWLAFITGARRGELCALAWDRLNFSTRVLTIRSSIAQSGRKTWEKPTKTHQQRRITLDERTVALLRSYREHCAERAGLRTLKADARIFSLMPDGSTWLKPDSVSQRYARMCARLGWDMNIHQLRHYSATELIAAGTDVRTVAGRLGHGGGGSTTLKVYSAWVAESDERASGTLAGRLPDLPVALIAEGKLAPVAPVAAPEDESPYKRIAKDLQGAIVSGVLTPGQQLPTVADLAKRYKVSFGTAQRAIAQLRTAGLVSVSRGKRAVVVDPAAIADAEPAKVLGLRRTRIK
ncbi:MULTISPECIES: tyrosine-type recombinase/integrase [unclassified Amycolatopsis]|uniref:tyrosine-type recombinase/integrase n=1 Tax=unclassified Amycolatopsis TaxID=2618356 RepID=UPI001F0DBB86|nr:MULTISPECIES: tyrosine-type recombinase/integrase [unclassified Amycolatopsis]